MITDQERLELYRSWRVSSLEMMKLMAWALKWVKDPVNRQHAMNILKREADFSLYAKEKIDKLEAWK